MVTETLVSFLLIFPNLPLVACLHITFVTYGYSTGYGRTSTTRHTAAALEVAIQEFNEDPENQYATLNVTCDHVVLEKPNTTDCKDAEDNVHLAAQYYYSQTWDDENVMAFITSGCGDSLILGSMARGKRNAYGSNHAEFLDNFNRVFVRAVSRGLAGSKDRSLAEKWDVFMGTTGFVYADTRNRQAYPNLVSVSPIQVSVVVDTLLALFKEYNWSSVGIIYDSSGLPSNYELVTTLKIQNAIMGSPIQLGAIEIQSGRRRFTPASFLQTARTFTRVIVLSMHSSLVRKFMLAAKQLNMTNGDYIFLTFTSIAGAAAGNLTWQSNAQDDQAAFEAYRHILHVMPCARKRFAARSEDILQKILQVSIDQYDVTYFPGDSMPSDVAIAGYIMFETYLEVLQEIRRENSWDVSGDAVGNKMISRLFNTTFGPVYIDEGGQRRSRHCVKDLNVTTGTFEVVMSYEPYLHHLLDEPTTDIDWGTGDGRPPPNEPRCGYLGTKCKPEDDVNNRIMPAVMVTLVVVACLMGILIWRIRREARIRSNVWQLDAALLIAVKSKDHGSSSTLGTTRKANSSLNQYHQIPEYYYQTSPVTVKEVMLLRHGQNPFRKRAERKILLQMTQTAHLNVVTFTGVCMYEKTLLLVSQFSPRGDLFTLLSNPHQNADWDLRCSLINDLIEGMCFIHDSVFRRHGNIACSTCMIDSRFTLKIAELGYSHLLEQNGDLIFTTDKVESNEEKWANLTDHAVSLGTNHTTGYNVDVTALGRVMAEVFLVFDQPQNDNDNPNKSQILPVEYGQLQQLIYQCTDSEVRRHRSAKHIKEKFRSICHLKGDGVMDTMMRRIEQHAVQLEKLVQERTAALAKERAICEELLLEILPRSVMEQLLKANGTIVPEVFPSSTIFFSHIWGFLPFVATHSPLEIFDVVSRLFLRFDKLLTSYQVFKVETVEDQYMVFSGVQEVTIHRHSDEICRMALALHQAFSQSHIDNLLQFMAGIHSGPCAAGVIGNKCPRYCLFGDTVNVASRIATNSKPARIHISIATADLIKDSSEFLVKQRGMTSLKGRGEMQTFWLMAGPSYVIIHELSTTEKALPKTSNNASI